MRDDRAVTSSSPCRYCHQDAHVPADACLTTSEKVGLVIGKTLVYVFAVLALIGLVLVLAQYTS